MKHGELIWKTLFWIGAQEANMRVVLQRVTSASVRVDGEVVGQIGQGLLCFVGIGRDDTETDAEFCCRRLLVRRKC